MDYKDIANEEVKMGLIILAIGLPIILGIVYLSYYLSMGQVVVS